MICLLFIFLLSSFGAFLCLDVWSSKSWPSGFMYCSDPEDRLTPRPVLARFDLKCSIYLYNLTARLGQKNEKEEEEVLVSSIYLLSHLWSNIYHLFPIGHQKKFWQLKVLSRRYHLISILLLQLRCFLSLGSIMKLSLFTVSFYSLFPLPLWFKKNVLLVPQLVGLY